MLQKRMALAVFIMMLIAAGFAGTSIDKYIPTNWTVKKTTDIPADKLEYYGNLFGGELSSVENHYVVTEDDSLWYKFQINVIKAVDENEAGKIYNNLNSKTAVKGKFLLNGEYVYEFLANSLFINKCRYYFEKVREKKVIEPSVKCTH